MLGWRNIDHPERSKWYLIMHNPDTWDVAPNGSSRQNIPNGQGAIFTQSGPDGLSIIHLEVHNPLNSTWTRNDIHYRYEVFP